MNVTPTTLPGRVVTLVPLTLEHAPALFAATPQRDPDDPAGVRATFDLFLDRPREWTLEAFTDWLRAGLTDVKARVAFAVMLNTPDGRADAASVPGAHHAVPGGRVVGSSSFLDIQPVHRGLEIGATWFAADCRGTLVNPECKLLMLTHAFEALGCVRVQLKCDARNQRSQRAIAKLGAVREGVLRRHRIAADGVVRDTVMFSITDDEWPGVKRGLQERLRGVG